MVEAGGVCIVGWGLEYAVRIVSGQARGRRLKVPGGKRVRPTGERVKEALFAIVSSRFGLPAGATLDLFAGSGSLGIEALSRGASSAVFVERGKKASSVIRSNLLKAGFDGKGEILTGVVEVAVGKLARSGRRFSLVLADPPYDRELVGSFLERLGDGELLDKGAVVVVEHSVREVPQDTYGILVAVDRRRYGDSCLSFYRASEMKENGGEGE